MADANAHLEINVVGAKNLDEIKEWFARQDPYVVIEYGPNKFRTRTDTDGGRNPSFNEKIVVPLAEGVRELTASVWNSNSISSHDHIGSARILLDKALSLGDDDTTWPLKSQSGK
jgi:Ca2+-dependent lipid-binding protein